MTRFGKNCILQENLSLFGKIGYFIHGTPHIGKFLQSLYFKRYSSKAISKQSKTVLDIGCGNGDYAFYLAEKYPWLKITAVDIDKDKIAFAKNIQKKGEYDNITFLTADLFKFKSSTQYDYAYCLQTLHAVADKEKFIKKISSFISSQGLFYFEDCVQGSYSKHIFGVQPPLFSSYRASSFKGKELTGSQLLTFLRKAKFSVESRKKIIGFFGQFAWEFDQQLQQVKIPYLHSFLIPILKFFCYLDFILNLGKKNEVLVLVRKNK